MRSMATVISFFLIGIFASVAQTPQPSNSKDGLTQCEEAISQKITASMAQYAKDLDTLLKAFQAKGDLLNLLEVKKEHERTKTTPRIEDNNIVETPLELRDLQLKYKASHEQISQQTAKELLPILVERKKKLTIEGNIDEAIEVKKGIEAIQQRYGITEAPAVVVSVPKELPTVPADIVRTVKKLPMSAQLKMAVSLSKIDTISSYSYNRRNANNKQRTVRQHIIINVRNIGMDVLTITLSSRVNCNPYYNSDADMSEGKESDEQTITLKPREEIVVNTPDYNGVNGYVVEAIIDGNVVVSDKR